MGAGRCVGAGAPGGRAAYLRSIPQRRPRMRAAFLPLGLALLAAGCAGAAPPSAGGSAQWWGGCGQDIGRPVAEFARRGLGTAARASVAASGDASIEYDPAALPSLSADARRFLYLRACAHHALGQVRTRGAYAAAEEREADCWAARALARTAPRDDRARAELAAELTTPADGAPALPGPVRPLDLGACIAAVPDPEAACDSTTALEPQVEYETRMVTERVPCTHCTTVGGVARCAHLMDEVQVPRRVPVVRPTAVTRRRCD